MLREIAPQDAAFMAALIDAKLPTGDLTSERFRYFSWNDTAWGGVGEGADALLRSVVVAPSARRSGHGLIITEALVGVARDAGVKRLWLLTTDAASFFEKLGWRGMERAEAPPAIAQSRQFSDLCPASAALMVRCL